MAFLDDIRSISSMVDRELADFTSEVENVHTRWLDEIEQEALRLFSGEVSAEPDLMPKTPSQKRRTRRKRVSIAQQKERSSTRRGKQSSVKQELVFMEEDQPGPPTSSSDGTLQATLLDDTASQSQPGTETTVVERPPEPTATRLCQSVVVISAADRHFAEVAMQAKSHGNGHATMETETTDMATEQSNQIQPEPSATTTTTTPVIWLVQVPGSTPPEAAHVSAPEAAAVALPEAAFVTPPPEPTVTRLHQSVAVISAADSHLAEMAMRAQSHGRGHTTTETETTDEMGAALSPVRKSRSLKRKAEEPAEDTVARKKSVPSEPAVARLDQPVVVISSTERRSADLAGPALSPGQGHATRETEATAETGMKRGVSLKLRNSLTGLKFLGRASRNSLLKRNSRKSVTRATLQRSICSEDICPDTDDEGDDIQEMGTESSAEMTGQTEEKQEVAGTSTLQRTNLPAAVTPVRKSRSLKRKAEEPAENTVARKKTVMKQSVNAAKKTRTLMTPVGRTPGSAGRTTVMKSFIKHSTPLKIDLMAKELEKHEALQKKQQQEDERVKKMEEEKRQKQEERKRKLEERQRKAAEVRAEKEEQRKKRIEQKKALMEEKEQERRQRALEAKRRADEELEAKRWVKEERERARQMEAKRRAKEEQERARQMEAKRRAEEELGRARKLEAKRRPEEEQKKARLMDERLRTMALKAAAQREQAEADKARQLENERRKEEERRQRALEAKRRANEEEQQRRAEAASKMQSSLMKTPAGKGVMAAADLNVTMDVEQSPQSYQITPKGGNKPVKANSNLDDYGMDQNSGDSTDDESAPRKPVPSWAEGSPLQNQLRKEYSNPPDLHALFGPIEPPNLAEIFRTNKPGFHKSTSSAVWHSPPMGK